MVLIGTGCAKHQQGTAAALRMAGLEDVQDRTSIATVTSIDRANRMITMKETDGDQSTVAVSDYIILGRMDIGDKVRVDYQRSLGVELLEPGESIDEVEFSSEALPAGVLFGRKVLTTVEILRIAAQGESTTFRSEDGSVHKVEADTKAKRTHMARLRPGDDVAASCTEKLSIKLHR